MKNLGYYSLDPGTLIKQNTTEYHFVDCSPDTNAVGGQVTPVTDGMVRELALKILDADDTFDVKFAEGVKSGGIPLRAAYIPIYYGHIDFERYGYKTVDVKRRMIWKVGDTVVGKSDWKDGVDVETENRNSYSEEFGIPYPLDAFFGRNLRGRYRYSISCYHSGSDPSFDQLARLRQFNHPAAYNTYDVMLKALEEKVKNEWGDSMTKEQKKAIDYRNVDSQLYLFKVFYYEGDSQGTSDAPFLAINAYEYFSGTYMKGYAGSNAVYVDHYTGKKERRETVSSTPRLSEEELEGIKKYREEEKKNNRIRGAQHKGLLSTIISFVMLFIFFIVNMIVDKSGIMRIIAVILHVAVGVGIIFALKKVDAVYLKNKDGGDAQKAAKLNKMFAFLTPVVVFIVLLIVTLILAR